MPNSVCGLGKPVLICLTCEKRSLGCFDMNANTIYSFANGLRPVTGTLGLALALLLMLTCGLRTPAATIPEAISHPATLPVPSREEPAEREARVPLSEIDPNGLSGFEEVRTDRTPNYLKVSAHLPDGPMLLGEMARSVLYDGTIDPDLKMAIGLAMSVPNHSPYTAAHMRRLLRSSNSGRMLLEPIESASLQRLSAQDRIAIEWAVALRDSVEGLDDTGFRELRQYFTEPQIVELTLTACFFSYFNRLVEATNLPIEPWVEESAGPRPLAGSFAFHDGSSPRIGLLSDREVMTIAERLEAGAASSSLGLRIANSIRAMARVPEIREAWSNLGGVLRDSTIGPVMQHLVSNEVSYRNDCYYCKTHQVQKLARSGMSPSQIAQIVDSVQLLDKREQRAVLFARQVSDDPTAVSDEQFAELREEFGDRGAMEILQVAARFNFMNRFTSGLRLPPEDAPRETYEQVEAARKKVTEAAP